jgi:hypothetical protein
VVSQFAIAGKLHHHHHFISIVQVNHFLRSLLLLPFSLNKCSAFFSKDKVYFGICDDIGNNKLLVETVLYG